MFAFDFDPKVADGAIEFQATTRNEVVGGGRKDDGIFRGYEGCCFRCGCATYGDRPVRYQALRLAPCGGKTPPDKLTV
jgi:hypothetical protein